jgi:hypothetical protein
MIKVPILQLIVICFKFKLKCLYSTTRVNLLGLANEEKIANLEHKVGGVYQKFQELNGTVDNLSRECEILKQRMVEKIKKITEKARNKLMEHCTSNFFRKTKL